MKHIEYEERVLLSESDYNKVIDDLKQQGKTFRYIEIENKYLDNDSSFIYRTKKMFRIRNINNQEQELTLKIRNVDNSTVEINETLESHKEIDKYLEGQFSDYKVVAKLITHRIEIDYHHYLLVIDKNIFHGCTDFDLEVESNSQQKSLEIIQKYCEKYGLTFDPHYHSKSHRAITRARELKK